MYENNTKNTGDIITNIIIGALVIGTAAIVIAGAVEAIKDKKINEICGGECPEYVDPENE